MRVFSAIFLAAPLLLGASGADIVRSIREMNLDPEECYRVRDLNFNKEDIRFYFADGYLIFAKPVHGARVAAIFAAETDGGDAEVLLMPPNKNERRSLASYTESPNMDEHFEAAVFTFTDNTYPAIMEQVHANAFNKKMIELGAALADTWSPVVRNIASSFATRLVLDIVSHAPERGFFNAALRGRKLGNFDVTYDPHAPEQIVVGQLAHRDNRPYLDVWTNFEARSFRDGKSQRSEPEFALSDYRIQADLGLDLLLSVNTRVKVRPPRGGETVFPFEISPQMRVFEALVDGAPAEVLHSEALRSNLLRNNGNNLFLVVTAAPLETGRDHEFEFHHRGRVIRDAGNRVFYVGARSNWYPSFGTQYATYDLSFRYPKQLDLVSAGEVMDDRTEGEWRHTRRRTNVPIRVAGFNLGIYERTRLSRSGVAIEVCANRTPEPLLQSRAVDTTSAASPSYPIRGGGRRAADAAGMDTALLRPVPRVQELAGELASALEFMSSHFGPLPIKTLTVSPVPGAFGQGFPGLIYLSTLSYLNASDRAPQLNARQQAFFTDLLQTHEMAHQWWGNLVTAAGYRDQWLMEALADYSALTYLEKRRGARALETSLENYKADMLKKMDDGRPMESLGSVVMGPRLETSVAPEAWRNVVYGKGSWIIHMLRRRMGDERFYSMAAELLRRYHAKPISTEDFRRLAAEFLPPNSPDAKLESFFEQWVYGTGIPALKISYSVKGKAPSVQLTGTLTQTEVAEDFSVRVPIEIQFARGAKPVIQWVLSSSEPVPFTVPLRQLPSKVLLDPGESVLRR